MKHLKRFTLLHSNDMHGDFHAEQMDDRLLGGISMLSGYVQKVRQEEENVLYAVAGDMFCGSLIDSEYKGLSTIELMNLLTPDVATLGNHEVDYGIAHLLFLEKCARFPIINANIYIKNNHVRLFQSHAVIEVGGIRVLFIGILTQEVLAQTKQEALIGALVDVKEAATEVGKICNSYQTEDIDCTVLLTHIGIEADKQLAALLDPNWGVDLIIGGHTHTLLQEPVVVAGIPIVQAVCGTDQIGRFDITVDTKRNRIDSYTWQLIPIDDAHCPKDEALEQLLCRYEQETEQKYGRYITRFAQTYTHPTRDRETDLGKIFADLLCDALELDLMMLGSGSLRVPEVGPIVTYKDIVELFPHNEAVIRVVLTGAQLKRVLYHVFREQAFIPGAHTEFYQYSHGLQIVCSLQQKRVTDILFEGKPIADDRLFRVGMHAYHYHNMEKVWSLSEDEIRKNREPKVLSTDTWSVLDEWMSRMEWIKAPSDSRWITLP